MEQAARDESGILSAGRSRSARVAARMAQGGRAATLKRLLQRTFAADGPFAERVPGFKLRTEQLEMAQAIAEAIEGTGVLVAEAGTGTGKTFAYLVPALLAGGKVIVSTGTKTLQDQLFDRDLPAVRAGARVGREHRAAERARQLRLPLSPAAGRARRPLRQRATRRRSCDRSSASPQ